MVQVSIVVPVYKVERFLERCICSLQGQTLKEIEIILVDDGSPDGSGAICDTFAASDSRITVIHKKNGGLSSARNAGLKAATGKYVGFVDSDDDVLPDMYEKMAAAAVQCAADVVMADYQRVLADGTCFPVSKEIRAGLYEKEDLVQEVFPALIMGENVDYGPLLSACHCIYDRCFLETHGICFAEDVKWSEDNLFSAYVGYHAERFYYMKGAYFYRYYQNPNTITTGYRPGAWAVYCRMNRYLKAYFLEKQDYDFSRQIRLHLLYYACNTLGMECANARNLGDAVRRVRPILNDPELVGAMHGFSLPAVGVKLKIQLWLIKRGWVLPVTLMMWRRFRHG